MFKSFFLSRQWMPWSVFGSVIILVAIWYQVELDRQINDWFGDFYNLVQQALGTPGSVTLEAFHEQLWSFGSIALTYIAIAVGIDFFVKHFIFRWRTAMNDYYMDRWFLVRGVEGAAQRVQEDTMRFARIMEGLGVNLLRSILTLVVFLPLLAELSLHITEVPYFGELANSLVYVALFSALAGTVLLAAVGVKLPGLEFENQKVEAAYRKELVFGEDDSDRAEPMTVSELYGNLRKNYFRLFFHYLYFDIAKYCYLQFSVLFPYIAIAPTIIAGAITLGVMQQIIRAFGKVEESFQYLVRSWSTIVELISVFKRLRQFEQRIKDSERQITDDLNPMPPGDSDAM